MNEIVKRAPDGKWLKGQRGGPGRKPMPAAVREMMYGAGEKAITRLARWVENDKEYEATEPELRLRLLNTAIERAYGKAEIRRATGEGEDDGLTTGQVVDLLDQVYDRLKAPELRYAMRADGAKDVVDAEEVDDDRLGAGVRD